MHGSTWKARAYSVAPFPTPVSQRHGKVKGLEGDRLLSLLLAKMPSFPPPLAGKASLRTAGAGRTGPRNHTERKARLVTGEADMASENRFRTAWLHGHSFFRLSISSSVSSIHQWVRLTLTWVLQLPLRFITGAEHLTGKKMTHRG